MWTDVFLSAIVCAGVIFLPGALVAYAARTRPLLIMTLAAPVSVTIVAATSVMSSRLGIAWGFLPLLLVTAVSVGIVSPIGLWRTLRARKKPTAHTLATVPCWDGRWWFLPSALGAAAVVHMGRLVHAIGIPDAFSQTYDSPFHHNVIAMFLERADASFLKVSLTVYGQENGFYPAVWHQLASLNAIALGTFNTGIATNGLLLTVTALLWPLSVAMLLGWAMRSWNFAALGALFSCVTVQMPNHFTWFGVLYPNLLAYSLLSFYLAVGVHVFWGKKGEQRLWAFFLAVVSLPGLAISHPSGAISFLLLAFPLLVCGVWAITRAWAQTQPIGRWVWPLLSVSCVLAFYQGLNLATMRVGSLQHMRTNEWYWPPVGAFPNGLVKVLIMKAGWPSAEGGILPSLLGVCVLIGAYYALRVQSSAWLVAAHAISVSLFLVAFSLNGPWRPYIIGMWYSDPERFAALTGVTGAPLIAIGIYASINYSWTIWQRCCQKAEESTSQPPLNVMVSAVCAFFVLAQLSPLLHASYKEIAAHMAFDTASQESRGMLSENELTLLERLPDHVADGDSVISNPWDGSVFAPAVSGVHAVYAHVAPVSDEDGRYLAEHLNQAATDDAVCEIVTRRHITHVLDFGPDYLWNGDPNNNHLTYPGLRGLEYAGVAEIVDQQGNAKLLRINACAGETK